VNCVDYFLECSSALDKKFILGRYETLNYTNLSESVSGLSDHLHKKFGSKQNILLMAENTVFFITSYLSILKSGNVCVPIDYNISPKNLKFVIEQTEPAAVFCDEKRVPRLQNHGLELLNENFKIKTKSFEKTQDFNQNNITQIIFTSGSTGVPKGVVLTHKNLIANTKSIVEYLKLSSSDVMSVVLPLFYCYGLSLLHTHLRVGGSLVLNNEFIFFNKLFEDFTKYKCTGFAGVPTHFQLLLRKSRFKEMSFPNLRYVTQAGGKLPTPYIKEFIESHPEVSFYVMYGQTEATARLSYLPPEFLSEKMGSIGKGIPGVVLKVLDEGGNPVSPGAVGEIVASGENIMQGYYKSPKDTARVLKEGELYTGDLATVDEVGFIYIVGREKEIVKVGGYRVSPKEVEEAINQLEYVVDSTVVGVEDEISGEALKAYIVLCEDCDVNEELILRHCRSCLPSYKVPKGIEFIDEIPMNQLGKKTKSKLEQLEDGQIRRY